MFIFEGEIVNHEIYQKIKKSPKFNELVTKRSRFAWRLASVMLVIYYSFILVIAFSPTTLSTTLFGGVSTIGIPIGVFIILLCFLLTGIYTFRANSEFDTLTNEIKDELRAEI